MASKKMTDLSSKSNISLSDVMPIATSGSDTLYKTTVTDIAKKIIQTVGVYNASTTISALLDDLIKKTSTPITYKDVTLDNISIESGKVVFKDFAMSLSDYTCIGVIMVQLGNGSTNGSGSSNCICTGFYPTSTGVHVNIRNQGSSTAIIKVTARGLFVKN